MTLDVIIIASVVFTALLLWSKRVRRSIMWRAIVTPLASIIGSGFLVLGPILDHAYGAYAIFVMLFLCVAAFGFGSAIRFNIASRADAAPVSAVLEQTEAVASWALAIAYVISVAYYLNLFGAFSVKLTSVDDPVNAKLITTAVFVVIMTVGWSHGFKSLERMEYVSVSAKLAIIAGLLVGLLGYFFAQSSSGVLIINQPTRTGWPAVALAFGLIITVQGFETSRYLEDEYEPEVCIASMMRAQLLAAFIYLIYIALISFVFERGDIVISETAIIGIMEIVAPILPGLLIVAALAAQFSAAVADTSGSGGLVQELTAKRVSAARCYVVLSAIGITLTWWADVFQLINFASRAFAIYYAIQSFIAALNAWQSGCKLRVVIYAALAGLGVLIVFTGAAVEGHG